MSALLLVSFTTEENHFNLLAVVTDRRVVYQKRILDLQDQVERAATKMGLVMSNGAMDDDGDLPSDPEALQAIIDAGDDETRDLEVKLKNEDLKHEHYKLENIRRRHNYLPLIMEVPKLLSKRG